MLPFLRILGICLVIFASANCQGTVKVHWMDQTYNEWLDLVAGVKTSLVTRLNEYCTTNDCKITSGGNNITANGVVFVGATDKLKYVIDGRFIICNIQVSTNEQSLTSEVLEAFMVNQRQNIVDDGKVAIAYVNKKLVYPPRDNLDNYLIISISSSIVLGLFILNIILTKKREHDEMKVLKNMATSPRNTKDTRIKEGMSNGKKGDIYTSPNDSEESKNRAKKQKNKAEESMPLNSLEDDEDHVPGFPKASTQPMLTTSESMYNGARVNNNNMRLTQV